VSRTSATGLLVAATATLYVIWFSYAYWPLSPISLKTWLLLDLATRVVLPALLLTAIWKCGRIGLSSYWLLLPTESTGKLVAKFLLTSFGLLSAYILVASLVGGTVDTKLPGSEHAVPIQPPLVAAGVITYLAASASFSEEVFFRGIPRLISMQLSTPWLRNLAFVAVSSAVFGSMHLAYGVGSAIAAAFFGCLAALVLIWTNNLWYPLVGHFITNLVVMWWGYAIYGTLLL
jgi:membrane protease YdiL (CAAX protease family)